VPAPPITERLTAIIEREYRFIPVDRLPIATITLPTWHDYRLTRRPDEHQTNCYLDTASQALARHGISFRRRQVDQHAELTLKLRRQQAAAHLFSRPEYSQPIGLTQPLADHPLTQLALRYTDGEPIAPWFTFTTRRCGFSLDAPDGRIHLTWDHLSLPDDARFSDDEIEAELIDGAEAVLAGLAHLLTTTYQLRYGDDGKRSRVGRYLARRGLIAFPGINTTMPG
jgi:inorganic triphosphatase YgiF